MDIKSSNGGDNDHLVVVMLTTKTFVIVIRFTKHKREHAEHGTSDALFTHVEIQKFSFYSTLFIFKITYFKFNYIF